jgi:hypothetical protein
MGGVTVGRHWQTNIPGRYLPVKTDGRLKAVHLKDGGFDLDAVTLKFSFFCFFLKIFL